MPGLTVNGVRGPRLVGDTAWVCADVTFDSSYPLGGESLTASDLGFGAIDSNLKVMTLEATSVSSYSFEYDYTNSKLKARRFRSGLGAATIAVKDDDNAASTGVAVYIHVDEVFEQGTSLCHLECVNAGNADSVARLYSGGPYFYIQDDDNAAVGGTALFFDENDTDGLRFSTDLDRVTGTDTSPSIRLMANDGSWVQVVDQDNPSGESGTVQVYFDDDATNDYERLLFVSPTNANGTDRLWITGGEVPSATDLSAVTTRVFAWAAK